MFDFIFNSKNKLNFLLPFLIVIILSIILILKNYFFPTEFINDGLEAVKVKNVEVKKIDTGIFDNKKFKDLENNEHKLPSKDTLKIGNPEPLKN